MYHLNRLIFLLICSSLAACGGEDPSAPQAYVDSRAAWEDAATENNDTYRYRVDNITGSGFGYKTTISVRAGQVIRREVAQYGLLEAGNQVEAEWTEEADALGTRMGGAEPVTIGVLYARCVDEVLSRDTSEGDIIFEVYPDGIMKTCVFWSKNCLDDCGHGYTVDALEWDE